MWRHYFSHSISMCFVTWTEWKKQTPKRRHCHLPLQSFSPTISSAWWFFFLWIFHRNEEINTKIKNEIKQKIMKAHSFTQMYRWNHELHYRSILESANFNRWITNGQIHFRRSIWLVVLFFRVYIQLNGISFKWRMRKWRMIELIEGKKNRRPVPSKSNSNETNGRKRKRKKKQSCANIFKTANDWEKKNAIYRSLISLGSVLCADMRIETKNMWAKIHKQP